MTQTVANRHGGQTTEQQYQEYQVDPTFLALMDKPVEFVPFMGTESIKLTPNIVIQYLCKPTKSGEVCSFQQATRFIMLCKARALNPWEGDAFLVGYDTKDGPEFNLVTAHQAFLKRAEAHKNYQGMESGVVVRHTETEESKDIEGDLIPDGCELVGGWARVHRDDRKIPCFRRIDLKAYAKPFGVWASNAAGMIVKCAEADALRSSFPNSLGGLYMDGEMPTSEPSTAQAPPTIPTNGEPAKRLSLRGNQNTATPAIQQQQPIKPEPTADDSVLTWQQLQDQHGITAAIEADGIAVFDANNRTLRPDGQWDEKFPAYTVNGSDVAADVKARKLAMSAITAASSNTQTTKVEAGNESTPPAAPPARSTRPSPK